MKCLNRIEMQEYADKEVSAAVEALISEHLASCAECKELFNRIDRDKALLNKVLSQADLAEDGSAIPQFIPPATSRKRINFQTLVVVAAAIITGFIFLVRTDRTQATEPVPEAEIVMYEFYEGKDLNKMWHEKSQIIILQDEEGNIIEPIITY